MLHIAAIVAALGAIPVGIEAQETFKAPPVKNEAWIKPFPPVRIVQFDMHKKYRPGDPYDPERFVDPNGYQAKIQFYEKLYLARLKSEREKMQ